MAGTVVAVSLVAKVRDTASELYGHAKARYAASDAMQRAGQQAGQAAGRVSNRVRDLSGKAASTPMAAKIRDLSGKAAAAVRDARAHRPEHR